MIILKKGQENIQYRLDKTTRRLKKSQTGEVLTGTAFVLSGGTIETDRPGQVAYALGIVNILTAMKFIDYKEPPAQEDLKKLVKQHGLTNQEIASRTKSSLSAVDGWMCNPWRVRHAPIPKLRVAMLLASIKKDPPGPALGIGRPRWGQGIFAGSACNRHGCRGILVEVAGKLFCPSCEWGED